MLVHTIHDLIEGDGDEEAEDTQADQAKVFLLCYHAARLGC